MIDIREAAPHEVGAARGIITEYVHSLAPIAASSFAHQRVDDELRDLPGAYAPPTGALLLAWEADACVGSVAVRPLDPPDVCELKRLYVRPAARGQGVGRRLTEAAMARARALGYRRMKLDSDPSLTAALTLYRALGFTDTPRYNTDPDPETVYLGVGLAPADAGR